MLSNKLFSSIGNTDRLYVDDVFSAYTYTDTFSTQTITNGIDLAGEGGLVWTKRRGNVADHMLIDTVRGGNTALISNTTGANLDVTPGITFGASGYLLNQGQGYLQANGNSSVSWAFRKAPKFFDVVTWTGNGANRTIPHSLGQEVGMMLVKRTDSIADWQVYHRSLANTDYMVLNSTAANATGATRWNSTTATTSNISLGADATVNASGGTYVAYLFAHDATADGIIQCGRYEATGATNTIELGWEPQFMLWRLANQAEYWRILDTSRGWVNGGNDANLYANASSAEVSNGFGHPTATGVSISNIYPSGTYIYLAIRRPNKPPTTGTEVYNAVARTGTGSGSVEVTGAGFAPDMVVGMGRGSAFGTAWYDRLRGKELALRSALTNAEYNASPGGEGTLSMDGVKVETSSGILNSAGTYINWFFKRAPGFFDVVCYTGTGAAQTLNHSLGVAPELVIVKGRQFADAWTVWHSALPNTDFLLLSYDDPAVNGGSTYWNNTSPTSSVFSVGSNNRTGASARPYVAYLFASLPGVSKVGSYVGNGASQTIDCGFASGARFVLIKTTAPTYTGGWAVGDSTRGIVAGNDPVLYLNTTAAEVTSLDWLDPHSSGFTVNETTGAYANTSGSTYVYLAIS